MIAEGEYTIVFGFDFEIPERHAGGIHITLIPSIQYFFDIVDVVPPHKGRGFLGALVMIARIYANTFEPHAHITLLFARDKFFGVSMWRASGM